MTLAEVVREELFEELESRKKLNPKITIEPIGDNEPFIVRVLVNKAERAAIRLADEEIGVLRLRGFARWKNRSLSHPKSWDWLLRVLTIRGV